MAIDVDTLEKLRSPMEVQKLDLSWLNLNGGHTWGMRAKPGKRGLTLDEIEIRPVAPENQQRAPRGQALPPHADHGRGAPPGRLPQARLRQRWRPTHVTPAGRTACDHRGQGLHGDVRDHARRGGGLRAVALPHG